MLGIKRGEIITAPYIRRLSENNFKRCGNSKEATAMTHILGNREPTQLRHNQNLGGVFGFLVGRLKSLNLSGGRGIRTPGTVPRTAVFKT
jgi:hypothetical protein